MKKLLPLFLTLVLCGCAATYDGPTAAKEVVTQTDTVHITSTGEQFTSRAVYAYDIYGNCAQYSSYSENELQTVERRRFDENGNKISVVRWDHSGFLPLFEGRWEYTYDAQGRCILQVSKNFLGIENGRAAFDYDDEAFTYTFTTSETDNTTVYYCDENWNTLRAVSGLGFDETFTYDDRGNCTSVLTYENGVFWGRTETEYDDQDRPLTWRNYDETGACTFETTYVYDDDAHTATRFDGDGKRIEYYTAEGELYLIEDYNQNGELRLYQQHYFTEIRVPADGKE